MLIKQILKLKKKSLNALTQQWWSSLEGRPSAPGPWCWCPGWHWLRSWAWWHYPPVCHTSSCCISSWCCLCCSSDADKYHWCWRTHFQTWPRLILSSYNTSRNQMISRFSCWPVPSHKTGCRPRCPSCCWGVPAGPWWCSAGWPPSSPVSPVWSWLTERGEIIFQMKTIYNLVKSSSRTSQLICIVYYISPSLNGSLYR